MKYTGPQTFTEKTDPFSPDNPRVIAEKLAYIKQRDALAAQATHGVVAVEGHDHSAKPAVDISQLPPPNPADRLG